MNLKLDNPFAFGNTANLYLYDDKIIKVFKKHLPPSEFLDEAKKQEYAYSLGLHVPKILEVTDIHGQQAIIMEYVIGKTVGELLINNLDRAENYINICVNVQKNIHAVEIDTELLEPMSKKLLRQIERVDHLNQTQKNTLLNRLDKMTYKPRLCHGDFHPFNLIMSDDKVYIIDWVDSSSGDIRADVYRTYLLFSQKSVDLADMYLAMYCKNTDLSRDEIFQWAPIIAAARLSENVSSESNKRLMEIVTEYLK